VNLENGRFVPDPETGEHLPGAHCPKSGSRRFAFVSDFHLVGEPSRPQQRVLDWVKSVCADSSVQQVILGGDLTLNADPGALDRFLSSLHPFRAPVELIYGNHEEKILAVDGERYREVHSVKEDQFLSGDPDSRVLLLHQPDFTAALDSFHRFCGSSKNFSEPILVFSHYPLQAFPEWQDSISQVATPLFWISGHSHHPEEGAIGNAYYNISGGIDLLKVRGETPEILIIDWNGDCADVKRVSMPKRRLLRKHSKEQLPALAYPCFSVDASADDLLIVDTWGLLNPSRTSSFKSRDVRVPEFSGINDPVPEKELEALELVMNSCRSVEISLPYTCSARGEDASSALEFLAGFFNRLKELVKNSNSTIRFANTRNSKEHALACGCTRIGSRPEHFLKLNKNPATRGLNWSVSLDTSRLFLNQEVEKDLDFVSWFEALGSQVEQLCLSQVRKQRDLGNVGKLSFSGESGLINPVGVEALIEAFTPNARKLVYGGSLDAARESRAAWNTTIAF